MPNDTPYVAQPNASPTEPEADRLYRGDDYARPDGSNDEYARAKAWFTQQMAIAAIIKANALKLLGNPAARKTLEAKTMPLLPDRHGPFSAPDDDDGWS